MTLDNFLQTLLQRSAHGPGFLIVITLLSLLGTATAAYPVTVVVIPAALLVPQRWVQVSIASALGSAAGATLLVLVFHHLGWELLYGQFPDLMQHQRWSDFTGWINDYGAAALFIIAATPLPQTPALIILSTGQHPYLLVFVAMLAGKLIKYGVCARLAALFPERFRRS